MRVTSPPLAGETSGSASASAPFSPVLDTYTVDCPEHPVLPDYQPRATAACEAGVPAPLCQIKSLTLHNARVLYEAIQRDYDRAVTLCRTQEINRLWPALRSAKVTLLEAELAEK